MRKKLLQAPIVEFLDLMTIEALHVHQDAVLTAVFQEIILIQVFVRIVGYSHDDSIILALRFLGQGNSVEFLYLVRLCIGIHHIHRHTIILELVDDIEDFAVPDIGDILLEGHSHHQNAGIQDRLAIGENLLDDFFADINRPAEISWVWYFSSAAL